MTWATFFIVLGSFFLLTTGIIIYSSYRLVRKQLLAQEAPKEKQDEAIGSTANANLDEGTLQLLASCQAHAMLAKGLVRGRRRRTGYFQHFKRKGMR